MNEKEKRGFVYLVGAGPGDPGLITVKGLECLKRCDVVVYDHLASERLLSCVPEGCKRIFAGKQAGRHSMKQPEINRILVEEAEAGHTVVRLKGGDPFVFGRGGEEAESLIEAGIGFEMIPGVTSAVAAPGCAGIPITHRAVSRSFHVITGHTLEGGMAADGPDGERAAGEAGACCGERAAGEAGACCGERAAGEAGACCGERAAGEAGARCGERAVGEAGARCGEKAAARAGLPDGFEVYAKLSGTLVFLMGLSNLPEIADALLKNGKPADTPAAVISHGTLPGQRTVRGTLCTIVQKVRSDREITSPAVIVVGDVAALHMEAAAGLPLRGCRIGVTGTKSLRGKLSAALEAMGAQTEPVLKMEIRAYVASTKMKKAYESLEEYAWLAFTSANAVDVFFDGLFKAGRDLRALGGLRFAAVGKGTQEALLRHGFFADYVPDVYTVKDLAAGLSRLVGKGDKLLVPRSAGGSPELNEILDAAGVSYEDIALYEVAGCERDAGELKGQLKQLDYVTFSSASGVEAFFGSMGTEAEALEALADTRAACIGKATAAALRRHGRKADVTAAQFSAEGLADAICGQVRGPAFRGDTE